jgi:hypothetical protein
MTNRSNARGTEDRMTRSRLARALLATCLLLAVASCNRGKFCEVCQRMECGNMAFTIRLQNGKSLDTCCPRCGLHYIEQEHPAVASLSVREFDGTGSLDARSAFYVEGSNVTPCSAMHASTAPRDERGCCMKQVYDRCLPSVLAFGSRERAASFAEEHGGTVKSFAELDAGHAERVGSASSG